MSILESDKNELRKIPLFKYLSNEKFELLTDSASRVVRKKNFMFCEQGICDSGNFFFICSGSVKASIWHETEAGKNGEMKEILISVLGPGKYFGEISIIDGKPRPLTIVAREKTELLVISKNDFENIVLNDHQTVSNILKEMLVRLREANEKIVNLITLDTYQRIARFIENHIEIQGEERIVKRITQQDIADYIGASRPRVATILGELKKGGYISTENKNIFIHKNLPPNF